MLFNSFEFLFLFLPLVLAGWHLASRFGGRSLALPWLLVCSLVFYMWWHAPHVFLLLGVVVVNYFMCRLISDAHGRERRRWLSVTVVGNLAVLGWYKYAGFVLQELGLHHWASSLHVPVALPLGVSFFTFQLVAFAVDVYKGYPAERKLGRFALVVSFFPHLIAGPILHPRKFLPQFDHHPMQGLRSADVAWGATLFVIGLWKKVGIADGVGQWANAVFNVPAGTSLTFLDAWTGALAYTFQLYFDFSGYSDMAIGLGGMFGLKIPVNFNSPYKAASIVDFWRRWHMTLSQLLKDYVYIPLGGNRKGPSRRCINIMLTMLIGGIWHGAGWTFLVWGGCHGAALVAAHAWSAWRGDNGAGTSSRWVREAGWAGTFLFVVFTWVLFRAESLSKAGDVYRAMLGFNGVELPLSYLHKAEVLGLEGWFQASSGLRWLAFEGAGQMLIFGLLLAVVKCLPNSQQIMRLAELEGPNWFRKMLWRPSLGWSLIVSAGLAVCLLKMVKSSEFLYFQF